MQYGSEAGLFTKSLGYEQVETPQGPVRARHHQLITPHYAGSVFYNRDQRWVKALIEMKGETIEYAWPHRGLLKSWSWAHPVGMCGVAALAVTVMGCTHVISRPDVVIGMASLVDIDYPLGASICRLLNLDTPRHGLRCAEEPSASSIANVESLRRGRIDLGIVPSDVLAAATAGQGPFASRGNAADLRVLFAGHVDMFTLIADQGSGIRTVADLRGKRIGIGRPGSRQRASMERVMTAVGLTRNDFADLRELSSAEQSRAFCADELDAIVYSVAHPNGLIRDATPTCHGMLIAVSGPAIDRMLSEHKEYERAVIPGGTYPVGPGDVHTFGVRAVVVTTKRLSDTVAMRSPGRPSVISMLSGSYTLLSKHCRDGTRAGPRRSRALLSRARVVAVTALPICLAGSAVRKRSLRSVENAVILPQLRRPVGGLDGGEGRRAPTPSNRVKPHWVVALEGTKGFPSCLRTQRTIA